MTEGNARSEIPVEAELSARSFVTGGAPASSGSALDDSKDVGQLRPPRRGDYLAAGPLLAATILLPLVLLYLVHRSVINLQSGDPLLVGLNYASALLAVSAFLWSWFKDWRWLHTEEQDITFLLNDTRVQRDPRKVLDPRGRRAGGKPRVETLLDDRVRRTLLTQVGSSAIRESDLRAVAAWRSASLGSLARYISGLLLLLTVLGTFIGVKSALDPLGKAFTAAATNGDAAELAKSISNVAAAFGSNLTALIGSMTLGLAAWALSIGRQNMLARLEQGSSLYVYPRITRAGPVEQLADAAKLIGAAGAGLNNAAEQLSGVREALVEQLGSVGDSVRDSSASIDDSLRQTRQTLQVILQQQATQVAEESRRTVDKIERQITDTTIAVQQATTLYGTMVGRLESDAAIMQHSSQLFTDAITELRLARQSFGTYVDSATRTLDERLAAIVDASKQQLVLAEKTYESYRRIDVGVEELVKRVVTLAMAADESETRRRADAAGLEQRIADRVEGQVKPSVDVLIRAFDRLSEGIVLLPQKNSAEMMEALREHLAQPANSRSSLELGPSLGRLVRVLENMEERAALPIWSRFMGRRGNRTR